MLPSLHCVRHCESTPSSTTASKSTKRRRASKRQTVLGYTAATTAAALFGPTIGSWAKSFVDTPQAGWYDKPMRWAQIGFAEDDPGNYDPQFWLDYFKRLHVEAVTLNAGGAVAFYPTQV